MLSGPSCLAARNFANGVPLLLHRQQRLQNLPNCAVDPSSCIWCQCLSSSAADTGLSAPSRWDLVSDKQAMQEEQPLQVGTALLMVWSQGLVDV